MCIRGEMSAKLKIILLSAVLFAASIARGQGADARKPKVTLRGKGQTLVLMSGGTRRTYPLKDRILAARLDEVKLVFVSRVLSFTYLVVDACGPSKLVPDARQCGAANECSLLWIKLDGAWKMSEIKSARYESCWQSASSSDGYKVNGRKLSMEYDDFSEKKNYKLSYDAEQPERGFQIEEAALEDTGSN